MKSNLEKMNKALICYFFGHDRAYITDEEAESGGWVTGHFRPFNCLRCDYKAERRKWPRYIGQTPPNPTNQSK